MPNDHGVVVLGSVHSLPIGRLAALAEDCDAWQIASRIIDPRGPCHDRHAVATHAPRHTSADTIAPGDAGAS